MNRLRKLFALLLTLSMVLAGCKGEKLVDGPLLSLADLQGLVEQGDASWADFQDYAHTKTSPTTWELPMADEGCALYLEGTSLEEPPVHILLRREGEDSIDIRSWEFDRLFVTGVPQGEPLPQPTDESEADEEEAESQPEDNPEDEPDSAPGLSPMEAPTPAASGQPTAAADTDALTLALLGRVRAYLAQNYAVHPINDLQVSAAGGADQVLIFIQIDAEGEQVDKILGAVVQEFSARAVGPLSTAADAPGIAVTSVRVNEVTWTDGAPAPTDYIALRADLAAQVRAHLSSAYRGHAVSKVSVRSSLTTTEHQPLTTIEIEIEGAGEVFSSALLDDIVDRFGYSRAVEGLSVNDICVNDFGWGYDD